MSNQNEILDVTQLTDESAGLEAALRPATLDEFVGQEKLKENLRIFIAAAASRRGPGIVNDPGTAARRCRCCRLSAV